MQEWSIIELQGDLEVENGESLASKFLGDLHFTTEVWPSSLAHALNARLELSV